MNYAIKFRRYNKQIGEARISNITWLNTNDGFAAAYKHADTLLTGMRAVDPDTDYDILEIVGRGVQGVECGGARMWETDEEFSARLAPTA